MWKNKHTFIVLFCIIMLYNFSFAVPSFFLKVQRVRGGPVTLIVGDGGDYSTIQEAIDSAQSDDTVYVLNGIYSESISILYNNLTIMGENNHNTIINSTGLGSAVKIYADYVNIINFNITSNGNYHYGIHLTGGSSYCNISNCHIRGKSNYNYNYGIYSTSGEGNRFFDNKITNYYTGIRLDSGSNGNFLINNSIFNSSQFGMHFYNAADNSVLDNCISNSSYYGAYLQHANGNTIVNNSYSNNSHGIVVSYQSQNNIIRNNTIEKNNQYGIWVLDESIYNLIYHNNFIDNGQNANDSCTSTWDNGYPSGGNYWSDYTGTDANSDGIGDDPYNVPGGSNTDNYPLLNPKQNRAPIAEAGESRTCLVGSSIILNGSNSYDLDEDALSFIWKLKSQPIGSDIILNNPTSSLPSFTPDLIGEYIFNLTVNDGFLDSEPDDVTITVISAPIIDSPKDITYAEGTTGHIITWNPTDDNPYYFNVTRDDIVVAEREWNGDTITVDIDGLTLGEYKYTCFVFDHDKNNASDEVTVTVIDRTSPMIIITSPTNSSYPTQKIWLNLTVNEQTPWKGYSLDASSNVTIIGNTLLTLSEGVHSIVVYANDSEGNMGISNVVWFTIDTLPPHIIITSPTTSVYSVPNIWLNFTVNEETSWICYSLDSHTNITITENILLTSLSDGSHTIIVYAKDIAGNIGASLLVTFVVAIQTTTSTTTTEADSSTFPDIFIIIGAIIVILVSTKRKRKA